MQRKHASVAKDTVKEDSPSWTWTQVSSLSVLERQSSI